MSEVTLITFNTYVQKSVFADEGHNPIQFSSEDATLLTGHMLGLQCMGKGFELSPKQFSSQKLLPK